MTNFIVKDTNRDTKRECETKADAEETRDDMIALGADPKNLEIEETDAQADTGNSELSKPTYQRQVDSEPVGVPDEPPRIDQDPVDWMPSHFVDTIQGVPTVNRKGYAVIAAQYDVSVTAEPVTLASETDFEYAEFRAVAETDDGKEYSGFGSAHVDRQDGDDPYLLAELAETRALKRALAYATGMGITAVEELKGTL